jgi:hypothetical protein
VAATAPSQSTQASACCGTRSNIDSRSRRRKRWPKEAHVLVANYLERVRHQMSDEEQKRAEVKTVITQLAALTGHSRENCWRFVRRIGVVRKQSYREWTLTDQQRLLDLISRNPACEVAKIMRRSTGAIRAMLHRLGASAQMGRDWFTVYTLAEALHTRASEIQLWIDRGWLKTRTVETGKLRRQIIEADEFTEFCKKHGRAVIGRRLRADRLEFVKNFVFPPSHTELLPVRESKKERAAFDLLAGRSDQPREEDCTEDLSGAAD